MKKIVLLLLLVISALACDEADNGLNSDFRDKYIGLYRGYEVSHNVGDTVLWEYETTSLNIEIEVGKDNDSSFETDYHFGNRYVCRACTRGPWHHIEFIEKDSIIVNRHESSFHGRIYYAKKE